MKVRRVVTGHSGGKSVVNSDGPTRKRLEYVHFPGYASALIWGTGSTPAVPHDGSDVITEQSTYLPMAPCETRFMYVTFPPDTVTMSSDFNPAAAGQEFMSHMPEFAQKFELDNPGMHTTDSVDYAIVLEGEAWLELDDGKQVHLKAHDVVVQNGTRHAWRNKTDKPVKMAFVLVGARRNK